jgi:hypothetical protein
MDALITVYSPLDSPRFRWAAKVFFGAAMKQRFRITMDLAEFNAAQGVKVNYSPQPVDGSFHISPHHLLWEKEIIEQEFYPRTWQGMPTFCVRQIGDLPFDPLAATFFLASRYEEYLPFIADEHQRFPASESFAFHHGFLERPLINEWALAIGELLFGASFSLKEHYSYTTTVDIDNLFAYKGKGALRTLGGVAKDLKAFDFSKLRERLSSLWNVRRDPYDTFRKQRNWNKNEEISSIYFMLFAEFGPKDRNVSPYSTDAAVKLREIADWSSIGVHPSYASNSDLARVGQEQAQLQNVIRRPVTASRQHYLKMRMPLTFRNLVELGITDEYSMGYAELPGFRASIAVPYTFYDLELEVELPLTVHPFAFMDVTYGDYLGLSAQDALAKMLHWIPIHQKVGGSLISVWHNRTFSEHEPQWMGWVNAYKQFIHAAKA